MIVKLGSFVLLSPLFRMYAVRFETSPWSLLPMNVVITNVPSGKFLTGPRSTSFVSTPSPVNDGSTAKPSDGRTTPAPITPPRPIVARVRKPARPYVSRCSASAAAWAAEGVSPTTS